MLKNCKLYVIIDTGIIKNRDIISVAEDALRGGADIIQLRDKSSCDRVIFQHAKILRKLARKHKRLFIINDRADIARAADVDGVHLGQADIPLEEARKIVGRKIIGLSTHSVEEAKCAQRKGADYIGIGPIFRTATKESLQPVGPYILRKLRGAIDIPFFAIGGISCANIVEVKKQGVDRVAVASSVTSTKNIFRAVKILKDTLMQK